MERIDDLLRQCVLAGASDLHFKCDTGMTYMRINGDLVCMEEWATFTQEEFEEAIFSLILPWQVDMFKRDLELDFAYEIENVSRFRGNLYNQRGHTQAAFRMIPYQIQDMKSLSLPPACFDFVERPRGLVLVTGPAGSGKSTTLAAMIDNINRREPLHIVTVEDPVEFVHGDHVALINQRELNVDTLTFANALKHVLRQDPDVILVGEMRDLETIHLAITAAETGHLVFGTLHTVDAVQTVDRVVDVFPIHQQQQIRMQLSVNLIGVLSQTLLKTLDNRGRMAAFEVLVANSAVRNMIRENKTYQIGSLIQTGAKAKMQTLDQSMAALVRAGYVSRDEAFSKAKDPAEFQRLLSVDRSLEENAEHQKNVSHLHPHAPTDRPNPAPPPKQNGGGPPPPIQPPPQQNRPNFGRGN